MADVPDSVLIESLEAIEQYGNVSAAARALNMPRTTLAERRRIAALRGLHLSEGAQRAINGAGLKPAEARGGWIVKVDPETGSRESTRWEAPEIEQASFIDRFREAMEDIPPALPTKPPEETFEDSLAFIPTTDVHIGLVVTEDETGHEEYNRQIAESRFKHGVSQSVMALPPSHTALIACLGDLTHANDPLNVTPRSKHHLRVEGTHFDNLILSAQLQFYAIDLALQRHGFVELEMIGGNHDPGTTGPILLAAQQRYRNEPRVKVNLSQNEWWSKIWGDAFLCANHGDRRKAKDACAVIPSKFRKEWGETKQAHYFSGHFHDYRVTTESGVMHHQLPAICGLDTHAAWAPYIGGAGIVSFRFDKRSGLKNNHITWL